MNVLVIDFETSGLSPTHHAILSVGWVLLDDKLDEIRQGSSLVRPWAGAIMDPKALDINKLTPDMCNNLGIGETDLLDLIDHQIAEDPKTKTLWAGQNPRFDFDFYQAACRRAHRIDAMEARRLDHHLLDSFSIGMTCLFDNGVGTTIKNCSLEKLAKIGKIIHTPHQSLADALATAEVLRMALRGTWRIADDMKRFLTDKTNA